MSLANDLRLLADFLEHNPEVHPSCMDLLHVFPSTKEEIADVARKHGPFQKDFGTDWEPGRTSYFSLVKSFGTGTVKLNWVIEREKVCELVVTGKETVKRPKMVQQGEEDVVVEKKEWRCTDSLLGAAS